MIRTTHTGFRLAAGLLPLLVGVAMGALVASVAWSLGLAFFGG